MPDRLLPPDLVTAMQVQAITHVVEVPDHTDPAFHSRYFSFYAPERIALGLTTNL